MYREGRPRGMGPPSRWFGLALLGLLPALWSNTALAQCQGGMSGGNASRVAGGGTGGTTMTAGTTTNAASAVSAVSMASQMANLSASMQRAQAQQVLQRQLQAEQYRAFLTQRQRQVEQRRTATASARQAQQQKLQTKKDAAIAARLAAAKQKSTVSASEPKSSELVASTSGRSLASFAP